ncbi:MAG TPA: hypothetical protein VIU62_03295 [Chloroflexota bacterium]|jgi:hypothetical protein
MPRTGQQLTQQSAALYERYGQPLEATHSGEYVAIAEDGRTLLATTLVQALADGAAELGPGNFVFKVGERVVAMWK